MLWRCGVEKESPPHLHAETYTHTHIHRDLREWFCLVSDVRAYVCQDGRRTPEAPRQRRNIEICAAEYKNNHKSTHTNVLIFLHCVFSQQNSTVCCSSLLFCLVADNVRVNSACFPQSLIRSTSVNP